MSDDGDGFRERWLWVDINRAADILGLRYSTFFNYLAAGRVKYGHHEGRFQIRMDEIEAYRKVKKENLSRVGRPNVSEARAVHSSSNQC